MSSQVIFEYANYSEEEENEWEEFQKLLLKKGEEPVSN